MIETVEESAVGLESNETIMIVKFKEEKLLHQL